MNDPSSGVPPQLLRHIALVCNHKYAVLPSPNIDAMVRFLQEAPKIVRDISTMTWMALLDPPPDGTLMLVWQPPQMTHFVSDGYIWADVERAFSQRMGPITVEMYMHQSGFRQGYENVMSHGRRRYRLVSTGEPAANSPPIDPSLWLIHYHHADPQNRLPVRGMNLSEQARQILAERASLQSHGHLQLQHKEFMLRDRDNWPTINAPGHSTLAYPQTAMGYPNNVMAHMNRTQHPGYTQNALATSAQVAGPSPAKRPRNSSTNHSQASATAIPMPIIPQDAGLEDEETTLGVDYMDVLTPREISNQRYRQHHEWLEEVINSPYDTRQIIPGELGLGRKGEVESLTKDFFNAHTKENIGTDLELPGSPRKEHFLDGKAVVENVPAPRIGRLESGKAEQFQQLAAQRMADIRAEMEGLKRQHTKRLAKLNKVHSWREAEHVLRTATLDAMNGDGLHGRTDQHDQVLQMTQDMERTLGKQIKSLFPVQRIDKGGLEETTHPSPEPHLESGASDPIAQANAFDDTTLLAGTKAQGPTLSHASAAPKTGPDDTVPQAIIHSPQPVVQPQTALDAPNVPADEWVMVNEESSTHSQDQNQAQSEFDSFTNDATLHMDLNAETDLDLPDNAEIVDGGLTFEDNDFTDTIDFGLDTAGDELSGYAQDIEQQQLSMASDMANASTSNQQPSFTSEDHVEPTK